MVDARNIEFNDNDVFSFYEKAMLVDKSVNINLNRNTIGHVAPEWDFGFKFFKWENFKGGAMEVIGNTGLTVKDNKVYGANYFGIRYNAKVCDETNPSTIMENNIVHSIGGFGYVAITPNRGGVDCIEVSYLKGYKNFKATV